MPSKVLYMTSVVSLLSVRGHSHSKTTYDHRLDLQPFYVKILSVYLCSQLYIHRTLWFGMIDTNRVYRTALTDCCCNTSRRV